MKLAGRFQMLLTLVLALAALVPILMVSLLHLWQSRTEATAVREQANGHARMAAHLVGRELDQAREAFAALRAAGELPLDQVAGIRNQHWFRVLYVTDATGNVKRYHALSGAAHLGQWPLPDRIPEEGLVLAAPPAAAQPDMPALAVAGLLPAAGGVVLVAELDHKPIRVLLTEYEAIHGHRFRLVPAGGEADNAGLVGRAAVEGYPLEVHAIPIAGALPGTNMHSLWITLAFGALSVAFAILLARGAANPLSRPFMERIAESQEHVDQMTRRMGESRDTLAEVNQQRNLDLVYSRATLYAVMESLNDGLVLITPDNRIRYINRHTEELLGLNEVFFPGRPAEELYAAVAAACEEPDQSRQQLSGGAFLTVNTGGRSPRYVRWQTFEIRNATGANLGLGHLLTDVTREREIDRVKSELISTVSHELRTPLTAIRASASSLLRPNVEWDEETRGDFLQMIHEESGRLQELIENLLDMSKIEAGVLQLETYPTDVGDLVEGAAARARTLHPELSLSLVIPPGLPAVNADRRRMEQVLLNLLGNAVKYGAGSQVADLQVQQQGPEVWVTVRDEGMGIPPEHLGLIFQRFHRVDSRLTRDTGGSGLGLAISRGIVEAHGGRMWVESKLGKGSTFFIALPVAQQEAGQDEVQGAGGGR